MVACSLGNFRCSITRVQYTIRRSRVLGKKLHSCNIGEQQYGQPNCALLTAQGHVMSPVMSQDGGKMQAPLLSCLPAFVEAVMQLFVPTLMIQG